MLHDEENELGAHLAYFDSTSSQKPKGIIPANEIDLIEIYQRSKSNRTFLITMTAEHHGKPTYLLRAPNADICSRWMGALKPFARSLSPYDVVARSALVFVLDKNMVREFAKSLKLVQFDDGQDICKAGERATDFFLLKKGKVGVYINRDGKERLYCVKTPISFFGEAVFTAKPGTVPVRTATCRAMGHCELLVLKQKDRTAFMHHHQDVKGQLHALLQSGIDKRIAQVPFLKHLSASNLEKFKLGLHYQALNKDEVLFYQGDPGHEFFIVYQGNLKIVQYRHAQDGKKTTSDEIVLKTVGKAECFGEIALMLSGIPRTATVVATTRALLLSLDQETFMEFLDVAKLDISVVMRERIVNTFKHSRVPFFDAIPQDKFHELAEKTRLRTYEPGQVIFQEGEVGDRFYIISFGNVTVSKEGKELTTLGQGKYFGEIALVVEDTARTATCKAETKTVLLSMSSEDFKGFFGNRHEALADVELKIAGSKCHLRSIMYHKKGIELFTSYLKEQYAEESIEFWLAVRKYRKTAAEVDPEIPDQVEANQKAADELVSLFINQGSDKQINISAKMRKKIKEDVAKRATQSSFLEAEKEIISLLARDKLNSFKHTQYFKDLMAEVGGYDVDADVKKQGVQTRGGSHIELLLREKEKERLAELKQSADERQEAEDKAAAEAEAKARATAEAKKQQRQSEGIAL